MVSVACALTAVMGVGAAVLMVAIDMFTPSPPTKSLPTKSPRVELSGRLPIKLYGHGNFHPLELRVCLSQTLWNSKC